MPPIRLAAMLPAPMNAIRVLLMNGFLWGKG
jgi:hypothetical protein